MLIVALSALLSWPRAAHAVKVDFLWVIDNSPSMAGEQAVLASAADDIAARLASARCAIDWRMAATYTDLHLAPTSEDVCPDAPGPGRRRVCPFIRDIALFRNGATECAYVNAGTCGDGSERGFNSASGAIARFLAGSGCEPVPGGECSLRPDARLVTIFLTDTGEQTPDRTPPPGEPDNSVASWADYFRDYDPFTPGAQSAQVHGILCPLRPDALHPAPCSDALPDPSLFDRYSDLVRAMGGTEGSVRDNQVTLAGTIGRIVDAAIVGACCGDGVVEPGEQCDDSNTKSGDCCSAACQLEPAGTECRAAAGGCDAAEVCSGTSPACPADRLQPDGAECRPATGPCDVPELCSGSSPACPQDGFTASAVECRPAAGDCDQGEFCSGQSAPCPADAFKLPAVTCRAAAGPCDVSESCPGSGALCPPDGKRTDVCRPAAGPCDTDERCDGIADACPADTLAPATLECRPAAAACDLAEHCTGTDVACPPDDKRTDVCRPAAGPCDTDEQCDGVTDACPANAFAPTTLECRPAAGACDLAEHCTGADGACPRDDKRTDVCRPAAGPCDTDERCDGIADACPADAYAPATLECRPAAGVCDLTEHCTGTGVACPPDDKRTGVCRAAAGACDVEERCDGVVSTCPPDSVRDGSPCNDRDACTQTDVCQQGVCTGTNPVACGPYPNECYRGECNGLTGTCSQAQALSGVPCGGGTGTCSNGTCNRPPDCSMAVVTPGEIWHPNHKWVNVAVKGIKDPDRDRVAVTITGITQDEPIKGLGSGDTCPDASGIGKPTAKVRAERYGQGDGRLYYVSFLADDGRGGQCTGTVGLCVPHDQKRHTCGDQGLRVDSAGACR